MSAIALSIVKHTERLLSSVHQSAVKTISLLMWAMQLVKEPNLSEWARRLRLFQVLPDGTERVYEFPYKKFRIWRFLTRSVFEASELWEAQTHFLLDPRDTPESKGPVLVTLDWTKLGEKFSALVLALPYHGRALPLSVEVVADCFLTNSMTDLEIELVRRFLGWLSPELRARIVILADRGFAKTELFEAIEEGGASYGIRLPRHHFVRIGTAWTELQDLPVACGQSRHERGILYTREREKRLHLAVRRLGPLEAHDPEDDTWYLATNRAEVDQAAAWYAKRFKEEELFRDLKSQLDLAGHQLKGEEGLQRLVALVGLYYVFVVLEGQAKTTQPRLRQVTRTRRGGPELSIFRQAEAVLWLWALETEGPPFKVLMPLWVQRHG